MTKRSHSSMREAPERSFKSGYVCSISENQITDLEHEVHEREFWEIRLEKLVEARAWRTLNLSDERVEVFIWAPLGI